MSSERFIFYGTLFLMDNNTPSFLFSDGSKPIYTDSIIKGENTYKCVVLLGRFAQNLGNQLEAINQIETQKTDFSQLEKDIIEDKQDMQNAFSDGYDSTNTSTNDLSALFAL